MTSECLGVPRSASDCLCCAQLNQTTWPVTPFGGWKASGFGREWGAAGMHEYLRHKTVTSAAPGYTWNYYGASPT